MPNEAFIVLWVSSVSMISPGTMNDAVGHAFDFGDARADGGAEHDEIERGREDRRDDALPDRAAGARHLETVDRLDGA